MRLAVTKALVKELRKGRPRYIDISYVEMNMNDFRRNVDSYIWDHEQDYDSSKGMFRAIEISYPGECYAMPQYATTFDLQGIGNDVKRAYGNLTVDNFKYAFWAAYMI